MTVPERLLEKYRTGVVTREHLADYAYKRNYPRLFRRRKTVIRAQQRWQVLAVRWLGLGRTLLLASMPFVRPPEGWSYRLFLFLFTPFFIVGFATWSVVSSLFLLFFVVGSVWRKTLVAILTYHRLQYHAKWSEPQPPPTR